MKNPFVYPKGISKAISAYETEVRDILIQALNLPVSDAQSLVESYPEIVDLCFWQSLSPSTACVYINDLSTKF